MRTLALFVLVSLGSALFTDEAAAQRWRGYYYPTYTYYSTPTYSYVTPASYYYTTPSYYYSDGYYNTYPTSSYYRSYPSYYYSYPAYSRGGVWYGDRNWGVRVRW
jgi:hypothetical protein